MKIKIENYLNIVGNEVISMIFSKARKLANKHIVHINSTYQGGGVSEMLNSLILLMNDVGVFTGWRVLHGSPDFFEITKKFHNALQGDKVNLSEMKKSIYIRVNENFSQFTHICHDCVIAHDPQPLPIVQFYRKRQPWIWRCHVDLSNPNPEVWDYLKSFLLRYDFVIVSDEQYKKKDLPVPQVVFYPAIDPLTPKNKPLEESTMDIFLKKFGIPMDKPFIVQVSRFDKWKDPEGVLEVFKLVREVVDCRLVYCGSFATDDPEGQRIYEKVLEKAKRMKKSNDIILLSEENNILVNTLQRKASVVIQKSLKEGFGLTVTEALWKKKPVVASNVGGIPLQIIDGKTGFLVEPNDIEGCAKKIIQILQDPELTAELGKNAKEHVKKNFLITRLLIDYLNLLENIFYQ